MNLKNEITFSTRLHHMVKKFFLSAMKVETLSLLCGFCIFTFRTLLDTLLQFPFPLRYKSRDFVRQYHLPECTDVYSSKLKWFDWKKRKKKCFSGYSKSNLFRGHIKHTKTCHGIRMGLEMTYRTCYKWR